VFRQHLPDQGPRDREDLAAGVRRDARLLLAAEEQGRAAEHVALPEVLQDAFLFSVANADLQEPAPDDVQVGRR